MRRIAVVAVLVMALAFCGTAFAFENEPEGFRGLKWGSRPTTDMVLLKGTYSRKTYTRADEKLSLGGAELVEITYWFFLEKGGYQEKFMVAFLSFEGGENHTTLKNICKEKFGEPSKDRFNQLMWTGARSGIILDYNMVSQRGTLMLADKNLLNRYKAQEQEQQAKDAEKDW